MNNFAVAVLFVFFICLFICGIGITGAVICFIIAAILRKKGKNDKIPSILGKIFLAPVILLIVLLLLLFFIYT